MNRTSEFIMSLIASVMMVIGWIVDLIIMIAIGSEPSTNYTDTWLGFWLLVVIVSVPMIVLEWVATFRVKKGSKGWGIFLIVIGALSIPSLYFVPGVLYLISGIMTVIKTSANHPISHISYDS